MSTLRLLISDSYDPWFNLAVEECIFRQMPATQRVLFLWRNADTVVIGRAQNPWKECNTRRMEEDNVRLARRSSGGGAVFHDLGNTCFTFMAGKPEYDKTISTSIVLNALNALGVPAQKNRTCDIAVDGKKISGSAQKIAGGRVLHHGTLLFDSDLSLLDEITTGRKNDAFCSKGTDSAICTVTNLRPYLKDDCEIVTFAKRLAEQLLPPGSEQIRLTEPQLAEVRRLADETYHAWDWTWGKTPAFTYEKSAEFAGKPIFVRYEARRGLLCNAEVRSDALDAQALCAMLNGIRLDPALFLELCRTLAGERAEELLDCLM